MKLNTTTYSYRDDPDIPAFSDNGPVTVMDAHCAICARGARWIAHNDGKGEFRIVPLQSDLGNALMHHYGMDPGDPLSWLYLEEGKGYSSLDAAIRVGRRLGGVWTGLTVLRIFPRPVQDWLYSLLARNRIRLGGTADLCNMPDAEVQKRLLT